MSGKETIGPVWVFDAARLEQALLAYQHEALTAYPQQEPRIKTAVAAVRDFLHSEHAAGLRMRLGKD